jgi:hypothetical protein
MSRLLPPALRPPGCECESVQLPACVGQVAGIRALSCHISVVVSGAALPEGAQTVATGGALGSDRSEHPETDRGAPPAVTDPSQDPPDPTDPRQCAIEPAPRAGSRTLRSPSTWSTPAGAGTRQWTGNGTSRAPGTPTPTAAAPPGLAERLPSSPNRSWLPAWAPGSWRPAIRPHGSRATRYGGNSKLRNALTR